MNRGIVRVVVARRHRSSVFGGTGPSPLNRREASALRMATLHDAAWGGSAQSALNSDYGKNSTVVDCVHARPVSVSVPANVKKWVAGVVGAHTRTRASNFPLRAS